MVVASPTSSLALDPERDPSEYQLSEWNSSHGIPYTSVRTIRQSADGYLWIGTRGGLARFDGVRFRGYTSANVAQFLDNEVFSILDDPRRGLLVATARGIVRLRDGVWDRPSEFAEVDSLQVRWLEDDGDEILIGTRDAVYRTTGDRVARTALPTEVKFTHLLEVRRTGPEALLIVAQPSWEIRDGQARRIDSPQGGPLQQIYTVARDSHDSWWLATETGLYELKQGRVVEHREFGGVRVRSARSVFFDSDDNFWIGSRNELMRVTDRRARIVERPGVDSLANFLCMFEDREGNLWGGNDSGLLRLSDVKTTTLTRADGLPARSIVSVLAAQDESIWVAAWGGGLARLDPSGRASTVLGLDDGLPTDAVWNLAEGPDRTLWLGFYDAGVGHLRDGVFTHLDAIPQVRPRLRDMKTDPEGNLWVSTLDEGLVRSVGNELVPFELPGVAATGAFAFDASGRLWVSWRTGVGSFDFDRGDWFERHESPPDAHADATVMLVGPGDDIWLLRDEMIIQRVRAGRLETFELPPEVGRLTYSGVVHRGRLWINFRNGIAHVGIEEFDAVQEGRKTTPDFEFITVRDGMRSAAPNVFAGQGATVDARGRILFANSKGIVVIDPQRIRKASEPPSVVIEEVIVDKIHKHPARLGDIPPGRGELEIHFTALGLTNAQHNRFKHRLQPVERDWVESSHLRTAYYGGLPPGEYRFEVLAANADGVWSETPAACTIVLPPFYHQTIWFWIVVGLATALALRIFLGLRERALVRETRRLEHGIAARTRELSTTNARLERQIVENTRTNVALRESEEDYRRLNEELEARVTARTSELEAANRELESFAYSVSHDLRAPLRGIDGWSLALREDYEARLDSTALGYIDRVRTECQRLGSLIDALLLLSRTTRTAMTWSDIDLSTVIATVAARVEQTRPGRRVAFTCEPGMTCRGDVRLLEAALFNLLDNAWKFTERTPAARIECGSIYTPRGKAFFIRDNGAGFDMRHAGKLFGVFQRMHNELEFPGTGVGLATVQRIVHRHGGAIWAHSEPGVATVFYFQLPPATDAPSSAVDLSP
jgi:signal transduction histidine kinase/ligand-binding sensor domain-containing protein